MAESTLLKIVSAHQTARTTTSKAIDSARATSLRLLKEELRRLGLEDSEIKVTPTTVATRKTRSSYLRPEELITAKFEISVIGVPGLTLLATVTYRGSSKIPTAEIYYRSGIFKSKHRVERLSDLAHTKALIKANKQRVSNC